MTWKSACCAVQGREHKSNGTPCQDRTVRLFRNGIHVIALADGAERARNAHLGAEHAAQAGASYLAENFDALLAHEDNRRLRQQLAREMRGALIEKARDLDCALSDLATTLLAVAVRGDEFILAHVGDGVIGWLTPKGLLVASDAGRRGASRESGFLTAKDAADAMYIRRGTLRDVCGFVIMSEGTGESLYNRSSRKLGNAAKKLMEHTAKADEQTVARRLEDALSSVMTKRTPRDCSIAILARLPEEKQQKQQKKESVAKGAAPLRAGRANAAAWRTSLGPMAARIPRRRRRHPAPARSAWKCLA